MERLCSQKGNEYKELSDKHDGLNRDCRKLKVELTNFEMQLTAKDRQLSDLNKLLSSTSRAYKQAQEQSRRDETEISELRTSVAALKNKLFKRKQSVDKLQTINGEQLSNIRDKDRVANTITRLALVECPSGDWKDIMDQVEWTSPIVPAQPTHSVWEFAESWLNNASLVAWDRTESITALFLLVISKIASGSLDDLAVCLVSISLRLD